MATITKSITDAKTEFSALVSRVESTGDRIIVKRRGVPAVMITRIGDSAKPSAAGILSRYANPAVIGQEDTAFAKAMEDKHATDH